MQTANGNAHRVSGKGGDWDFALRYRKRKEHGAQRSGQRRESEGFMELLQWRQDKEAYPVRVDKEHVLCIFPSPHYKNTSLSTNKCTKNL